MKLSFSKLVVWVFFLILDRASHGPGSRILVQAVLPLQVLGYTEIRETALMDARGCERDRETERDRKRQKDRQTGRVH